VITTLDIRSAYLSTYAIRRFEERASELRHSGEITCSLHLCIGQEQVAVSARAALADADVVVATYRGHHWAIACGVPLDSLFAEFLGREAGINGGRAGAGLLMAPQYGFLGETGIVGAGAPIGVGAALASRYDGSGRVSLVAFGDGALNQGAVHEAMNFAAVFDLGVIFLCENNGYAEFTRTETMFRIENLADRASAYGFAGETVDGSDVQAVHEAVVSAADRARRGKGPAFIDVRVRRLEGHHTHDPEHYRPKDEKAAWWEADPLAMLRRQVLAGGTDHGELDELERQLDVANEEALVRAKTSAPSDPNSVAEHLYA
jgi:TPP-dependent pyruvate/acetoin dehydrogenase alpha subunit